MKTVHARSKSPAKVLTVDPAAEPQPDHLLKEFLDLVTELNYKAARYASIHSIWTSDAGQRAMNQAALSWMQASLEDVAATAVGISRSPGRRAISVDLMGDVPPSRSTMAGLRLQDQTGRSSEELATGGLTAREFGLGGRGETGR